MSELCAKAAGAATENIKREGFDENRTTFGAILRGDLPASIVFEDDTVIAFADISPASEFHYLVIPKRHIRSTADLVEERDRPLLDHMARVGEAIAAANGFSTAAMGFHRWPFLMISHLHLHVIFPFPPARTFWHRTLFPAPGGYGLPFDKPEDLKLGP